MTDHAQQDRQGLIHNTAEHKRRRALQYLGTRWVLHPVNRVQRLAEPLRAADRGSSVLRSGRA